LHHDVATLQAYGIEVLDNPADLLTDLRVTDGFTLADEGRPQSVSLNCVNYHVAYVRNGKQTIVHVYVRHCC